MFNPQDEQESFQVPRRLLPRTPPKPPTAIPRPTGALPLPPPTLTLLGADQTLHGYLDMSETCRKAHGFSRIKGKVYLVDEELVSKMEPLKKECLRSWVAQKIKEGVWGGVRPSVLKSF